MVAEMEEEVVVGKGDVIAWGCRLLRGRGRLKIAPEINLNIRAGEKTLV
jgi:hypothetical protein